MSFAGGDGVDGGGCGEMKRRGSEGRRDVHGSTGKAGLASIGSIAAGRKRRLVEPKTAPGGTVQPARSEDGGSVYAEQNPGVQNENSGSGLPIGMGDSSVPNFMKFYDSVCTICGARDLLPFGQRTDGIRVLQCAVCGHGIVEHFQDNVQSLHEDEYFSAVPDSAIGYQDYAFAAEQGVAWAASLLRILKPGGQVLDIGCADGRALQPLGEGYDCFGIELNQSMAQQGTMAGVRMIARDLLDSSVEQRYAGCFDAVLVIAVFEHIPNFKEAFRTAAALLKPDGILIFEVPLIQFAGDAWYRSSLERIHYPTESSIEYLFREILHLPLTGSVKGK